MKLALNLPKKLRGYASYALLCTLFLGGALCSAHYVIDSYWAAKATHRTKIEADYNLLWAQQQSVRLAGVATRAAETKSRQSATLATQVDMQTELAYNERVILWTILALFTFELITVYTAKNGFWDIQISGAQTLLFVSLLYHFADIFNCLEWSRVRTFMPLDALGAWLLGTGFATLSLVALYRDFFRVKPITVSE